jgi:hypothetical protein
MPATVCGLCALVSDLEDSHLMPKWAYRRLRKESDTTVYDPIIVRDGRAAQTSSQISRPLLCRSCEQRFSTREDYLARLSASSRGEPAILERVRLPAARFGDATAVEAVDLDVGKIAYFVASIVWRAATMGYADDPGGYIARLRAFLLDVESFPDWARVTMEIIDPRSAKFATHDLFTIPNAEDFDTYHRYDFLLCGFYFAFYCGRGFPLHANLFCLATSSRKHVVWTAASANYLLCSFANDTGDAEPSQGLIKRATLRRGDPNRA